MTPTIRDWLLVVAALAVLALVVKSWPVVDQVTELLEDAEKAQP